MFTVYNLHSQVIQVYMYMRVCVCVYTCVYVYICILSRIIFHYGLL